MRKNTSGQTVSAMVIAKADGTPVTTGSTTCYVTIDGGAQAQGSVGSGACTHKGNGEWQYAPAQAETNGDRMSFVFVHTSGVNVLVQERTQATSDTAAIKAKTDGMAYTVAGFLDVNVLKWNGGTIPATNVTGVPIVDLKYVLGTLSPAAAGSVRADAGDPLAVNLPGAYIVGSLGYRIGTYLDAAVSSRNATTPPTASAIADAVCDEALSGHTTPGSVGAGITAAGNAGDPWATTDLASYGAGTAGKLVADNLNAAVSSRAVAGDAMALTTAEREATADAWGGRNIGGGANGGRTNRDALRALRNKVAISGGTLTVMAEDDSTPAWTAAVTTAPGDPLTGIDPAGP